MESWQIENCVIYVCATAGVIGLYALSDSWNSLWVLALLGFVNMPRRSK